MGHFISKMLRCRSFLQRFARDRRGVSAVEFALIAPLFVVIFFGTIEISQAVAADRKANILARTLSDLVSRYSTVTDSDMSNIFLAATAVMTPFAADSSKLKSVVTAVSIDASGVAKVAWSDTKYGNDPSIAPVKFADHALNDVVSLPAALAVPNTQLIWSEVTYTYTSPVSYFIVGGKSFKDESYVRPREVASVARTS